MTMRGAGAWEVRGGGAVDERRATWGEPLVAVPGAARPLVVLDLEQLDQPGGTVYQAFLNATSYHRRHSR